MQRQQNRTSFKRLGVVNESDHGMNFYSKVLALYTSFPTERQIHLSIKGVKFYTRLTYTKITIKSRLLKYQVFKNRLNTSSVHGY